MSDDELEDNTSLDAFKSSITVFSFAGGSSTPTRSSPTKRSAPSYSNKLPQKKVKRSYAPPETYAHLDGLQDYLSKDLDVIFCGINPGCMSAETGNHFASPTNHFWRCLHESGFTDERLPPSAGHCLPDKYGLGLTNLVDRPSAEQAELSTAEMTASVPTLLDKFAQFQPRVVCFVGVGIWNTVEKVLLRGLPTSMRPTIKPIASTGMRLFKMVHLLEAEDPAASFDSTSTCGAQRETLFFVAPSTSGRVQSHQLSDKVRIFMDLKNSVEQCKRGGLETNRMVAIQPWKT